MQIRSQIGLARIIDGAWPADPTTLTPVTTNNPSRFLAFDTSTDILSVGVSVGAQRWLHQGPGAAKASSTLIPIALDLLVQAGLRLRELDAIVFGRGPGSFTGLRTSCAVAQGLAAGSERLVLPIDTLMAVAEEARLARPDAQFISAVLDARMDEVYLQHFSVKHDRLQALAPCQLCAPQELSWPVRDGNAALHLAAGNAMGPYAQRLPRLPLGSLWVEALPTAAALLSLAPRMLEGLVPAEHALPLYIRDKVALTTEERLAAKAAGQVAA